MPPPAVAVQPKMSDVPASERNDLLKQKLAMCAVVYDFTVEEEATERDAKRQILLEVWCRLALFPRSAPRLHCSDVEGFGAVHRPHYQEERADRSCVRRCALHGLTPSPHPNCTTRARWHSSQLRSARSALLAPRPLHDPLRAGFAADKVELVPCLAARRARFQRKL